MRGTFINTFKTFVLLAFLGALFIGIGAIFGTGGLIIGAVLALAFVGGTFWFSDKIAVAAARAKPVSREEAPRLYEIVEDLARRNDMPTPRLYVSPEPQPNAFATGPRPEARRRRASRRASSRCSTTTSCAGCSPTRCRTFATATSSSDRSRPRSR